MGDRGATATILTPKPWPRHYSRWEIGEQPQLVAAIMALDRDYSRWEIGEQPQLVAAIMALDRDYSRWEIGEQPQQCGGCSSGWRL